MSIDYTKSSMAIRVESAEHSKILQEMLFSKGYHWSTEKKDILNLEPGCYVYAGTNGLMTWDKTHSVSHYGEYVINNNSFQLVSEGKWKIR